MLLKRQRKSATPKSIEKVIDRPTQTPLCDFTFATQKPLIKASLWRVCLWAIYLFCMI